MATMKARHRELLAAMQASDATVEDLARAWASIDGKRDRFDAGRVVGRRHDTDGTYEGYLVEAEEVIQRATRYALQRRA